MLPIRRSLTARGPQIFDPGGVSFDSVALLSWGESAMHLAEFSQQFETYSMSDFPAMGILCWLVRVWWIPIQLSRPEKPGKPG
jgi:hypothetical protein